MSQTFSIEVGAHTITGLRSEGHRGQPLLVCVPGGSYTSRYFDVPGHSLLETAAAHGMPTVAVDRPGYAGSSPAGDETTFSANAEVINAALTRVWSEYADTATGVVLVGHSMGGAVAVHMAAAHPEWPLLGVVVTAVHTDAPENVARAWASMPPDISIEFDESQRRQFMYGPVGSYADSVIAQSQPSWHAIPVAELLEIVGGWVTDFHALAARVEVPVYYALAEHEGLWNSSPDNVAAFGAAFSASPSVTTSFVEGSGHNIDHHDVSSDFHQELIAWAAALSAE